MSDDSKQLTDAELRKLFEQACRGLDTVESDSVHLDEDEIVRLGSQPEDSAAWSSASSHLNTCRLCRAKVRVAQRLLRSDGISPIAASSDRASRLLPIIQSAVSAESAPARLEVVLGTNSSLRVRGHDIEMRYTREARRAVRRTGDAQTGQPVSFRRSFGPVDVRLELSREAGSSPPAFTLTVFVNPSDNERLSAELVLGDRTIASYPLKGGQTRFSDLQLGAYGLQINDRQVCVGKIQLGVSADEGAPA